MRPQSICRKELIRRSSSLLSRSVRAESHVATALLITEEDERLEAAAVHLMMALNIIEEVRAEEMKRQKSLSDPKVIFLRD